MNCIRYLKNMFCDLYSNSITSAFLTSIYVCLAVKWVSIFRGNSVNTAVFVYCKYKTKTKQVGKRGQLYGKF